MLSRYFVLTLFAEILPSVCIIMGLVLRVRQTKQQGDGSPLEVPLNIESN